MLLRLPASCEYPVPRRDWPQARGLRSRLALCAPQEVLEARSTARNVKAFANDGC